jgi:hypothetical protein
MAENYHRAAKLAKRKLPPDGANGGISAAEITLTPSGPWDTLQINRIEVKNFGSSPGRRE